MLLGLVAGIAASITAGAYSAVRIGGAALGTPVAAYLGTLYGAMAGVLGVATEIVACC